MSSPDIWVWKTYYMGSWIHFGNVFFRCAARPTFLTFQKRNGNFTWLWISFCPVRPSFALLANLSRQHRLRMIRSAIGSVALLEHNFTGHNTNRKIPLVPSNCAISYCAARTDIDFKNWNHILNSYRNCTRLTMRQSIPYRFQKPKSIHDRSMQSRISQVQIFSSSKSIFLQPSDGLWENSGPLYGYTTFYCWKNVDSPRKICRLSDKKTDALCFHNDGLKNTTPICSTFCLQKLDAKLL